MSVKFKCLYLHEFDCSLGYLEWWVLATIAFADFRMAAEKGGFLMWSLKFEFRVGFPLWC